MTAFESGENDTQLIFNPYSAFNIDVDPEDYCSWCSNIIPENVLILGTKYLVTEALIFCSITCRDHYERDSTFHGV